MIGLVLSLLISPAHADDAMLNVCKAQRNQAMEWHLAAEAERATLAEKVKSLEAEIAKMKKEKEDAEHKP